MKIKISRIIFFTCMFFAIPGYGGSQDVMAEKNETRSRMDNAIKSGALNTRAMLKTAIKDLATRLDLQLNEIKTVRVEHVTWRNGSLGCPKEGMAYTQALVPGTLIVLHAKDTEHEYHAGTNGVPFLCENPESPVAGSE